jgi:uncharacterized protein
MEMVMEDVVFMSANTIKFLNLDRKLTKEEVVGALRQALCLELEAVQIYRLMASNTDFFNVQKIMRDIADEEVVHCGELIRLIFSLDDKEHSLYKEGFAEVENMLKGSPLPKK